MSTEIKPGQVWAWNDGRPTVQILHVTGSLAFYRILPGGEDHYAVPLSTLAIEAHLVTDGIATPAPLDPSKVRVGDTVTVTQRTATVEDEVVQVTQGPHWHFDLMVYPSTVILGVPGVDDGLWTLTAHQPAPEPEPEWKPGTVAVIEVDGDHTYRAIRNDGGQWDAENAWTYGDSEVTDVRPLVVIDPAAVDVDALVEVAHRDRVLYGDTTPDQMRRAILRILAHMGIEAS